MFIKRDTRKVPEILVDEDDSRKELKLGRREAEFGGSTEMLLRPANAARLANLEYLSLYHNKLARLDHFETLCDCTALTGLNLGNNAISALPAAIGDLASLRRLWVEDNCLGELPDEVCRLEKLELLEASGNAIVRLPASIGSLLSLKELSVEGNRITELPAGLCALTGLEALLLRGNCLTSLPADLGKLESLKELHVNSNRLTGLPDSLGRCSKLTHLIANGNLIASVPASLAVLDSLEEVNLAHNKLAALPAALTARWAGALSSIIPATPPPSSAAAAAAASPATAGAPSQPTLLLIGNPIAGTGSSFSASQMSQPLVQQIQQGTVG
ncbi:hypothetical protein FNF27_08023 [Cafeteria roenbergensis]|uniref:Disease resistance R13L4/SHOC-2-like LRR domain-containing protein n=1 Tax=Cafeteria roenbergensis TaxID=33653 RepID=A0A5A8DB09_CAFRO|nr:hypothetical protein FNF31_07609 [Cafeteria roenbergensis]KAA0162762.1 hypothetical protein FNF27_08023 [Cafeteria roenbergensis]